MKAIDCNDVSAWDWQWYFTMAAHNMLGIYPQYSLITNIGFGAEATHTSQGNIPSCYISHKDIEFPLNHPQYVVPYIPLKRLFIIVTIHCLIGSSNCSRLCGRMLLRKLLGGKLCLVL